MEVVFKLVLVLFLLLGARFAYFRCSTELGLEIGWERAGHDPFQKMTSKTKRDYDFNSRLFGSYNIPFCLIIAAALAYRIFVPT
jgi:hypothetical protein